MSAVLVTGGSGFFGSYLVKELSKTYDKIYIYDTIRPNYKLNNKSAYVNGNILDRTTLSKYINKSDLICHTASLIPPIKSEEQCYLVNIKGTKILLEESLRRKNRIKIIHISSSAVYGIPKEIPIKETTPHNPLGAYAISKERQEILCKEFRRKGLKITIMRPRTIIGEGMHGIFETIFFLIRNNMPIPIIGHGNNLVQNISAEDFAKSCSLASNHENKEFNIGSDRFSTLNDDITMLIKAVNSKSRLIHINAWLCKKVFFTMDILGLAILDKNQYQTYDKDYYFNISYAKRLLGFKPVYSNIEMLVKAYKAKINQQSGILKWF